MIKKCVIFGIYLLVSVPLFADRNPFVFQSYAPHSTEITSSMNLELRPSQNTWIADGNLMKMTFNGSVSSDGKTVMLFSFQGKYYRLGVGEIAPNGMEILGLDGQKIQLKKGEEIIELSLGNAL